MVLYYALGGGLGHITRARRVLAALRCEHRAALLTASPFASDRRITGGLPVIAVPPRLGRDRAGFRRWLADALSGCRPDELIVDSFPGGILGELCGMALPPARHVARRLRWPVYARRLDGALPRFELTHALEPLAEPHARRLGECSRRVQALELAPEPMRGAPLVDMPHWLVVHSGPDREVLALAQRAASLRAASGEATVIVVISPRRPSSLPGGSEWRDVYPVRPHLAHASRLVTAAGFNTMHETATLRDRHEFVPFPRPLDDQFARAAAARRVGALTADR